MDHTRIEGLSDGVFAIAIALLLISADVSEKFSERKEFLKDFVPFGGTISLLIAVQKIGGENRFKISGWSYFLPPVVMPLYSISRAREKKKLYET